MNKTEQIIKLAQFEGWTNLRVHKGKVWGTVPDAKELDSQGALENFYEVPDYFNDLNAVHRLEKKLLFSRRQIYYNRLRMGSSKGLDGMVVTPEYCIMATAERRAEAMIETLEAQEKF